MVNVVVGCVMFMQAGNTFAFEVDNKGHQNSTVCASFLVFYL